MHCTNVKTARNLSQELKENIPISLKICKNPAHQTKNNEKL